jgi:tetrahydromethanopterin S-methyltransferase subunit G
MSDVSNAAILEYLEQFSATTASYFQKIERRLDSLETRVTGLEGRMRGMELRMDRIEARIDSLEGTVESLRGSVVGGFADVGERLRRLEAA